jgi:predicted  nucleic acid-binding Zn-ribbon protein
VNDFAQIKLLKKLYELETSGKTTNAAAIKKTEQSLNPRLLKRYLQLKERKGTAVALLRNGVCSGCNIAYPDTHEMFRQEEVIHICEFCGRFLLLNRMKKAANE